MKTDRNDTTRWDNFDSILDLALSYWPNSVDLSTKKNNENLSLGFNAFTFNDEIGEPYFNSVDCKHIVRHMLWAIFCALPKDIDGHFELKNIDKEKTKQNFESNILSDTQDDDFDSEELEYFHANLKKI